VSTGVWSTTGWASAFADEPLFGTGVIDFAGCACVHMVGGFSALAGAAILGPRTGRITKVNGKTVFTKIPGHNASLILLGVFVLWFGWYGFNPGSALAIIGVSEVASLAAINTTLSAAGGTMGALGMLMLFNYMKKEQVVYDLIGSSNGTLAGLVGITSACATVEVSPPSLCMLSARSLDT
jgi:ammonium transporter, Amt family